MPYQSKLQNEEIDLFFETILSLKDIGECYMYFEDICTIAEINAIAQRLKVAMLLKDRHTCQDISQTTGVSTATISRVNKCLHYGSGGYDMVISRLKKKDN
jgi:TrpR-related protein YerC/YecD